MLHILTMVVEELRKRDDLRRLPASDKLIVGNDMAESEKGEKYGAEEESKGSKWRKYK